MTNLAPEPEFEQAYKGERENKRVPRVAKSDNIFSN
jgi:hypothetical protein